MKLGSPVLAPLSRFGEACTIKSIMQRGSSWLRQGLGWSRRLAPNARDARLMHSRHINGITGVAPNPTQSHVVGDTRNPLIVTTIGR